MQWLEHKIPPPVVALACAFGMWAWGPTLDWAGIEPLRKVVAAVIALAGLGFDAMGLLAFYKAKTTINPLRPGRASALVACGVYRVTRNPMYVGLALVLFGWALLLGGGALWLGPVLFVAFITRFQIVPEERVMDAKFGDDYAAYCRQVRRWL
jgi:protein-S-isoprenylcysteine O-methyltransferase Ste14